MSRSKRSLTCAQNNIQTRNQAQNPSDFRNEEQWQAVERPMSAGQLQKGLACQITRLKRPAQHNVRRLHCPSRSPFCSGSKNFAGLRLGHDSGRGMHREAANVPTSDLNLNGMETRADRQADLQLTKRVAAAA